MFFPIIPAYKKKKKKKIRAEMEGWHTVRKEFVGRFPERKDYSLNLSFY